MLDVVLCGGQSTRMGSDKGLLKYRSKTWAEVAVDKLQQFELRVIISINSNQFSGYSEIFSPKILVEDDESLYLRGPLAALLTIHKKFPLEDLMVLACDMLLMETTLLKELLSQYKQHTSFDAFIYTNNAEPEPLCGIYKANALNKIFQLYQANQLTKHSMKYALEQINVYTIPLTNDKKKFFKNFNTSEELNSL
jgi:molybdopterin-guanine dinucleotide biosynthesis protein A